MIMDLGKEQPLHYIGVEMAEYPLRKRFFPNKIEFSISRDGVKYTPVAIDMPRWREGRKDFQIVTVGTTVSGEARYIRINMELVRSGAYLSEIIVN